MLVLRRLLIAACALALLGAPVAHADGPSPAGPKKGKGKSKGKGKPCKAGYKRKTLTRKGKQVKVCVKVKPQPPKPAPAPAPAPAPPPAPAGLFEAPGRQLNGEEAKSFLQKYLANSTFTDCPTGWPTCGGFEDRYSHSSDGTFYKCWLRPTSGSDVKSVGEYGVNNSRVEPDGSWIFQETVYWYGNYAAFEWKVSATGIVEGAYQSDPGAAPEKIGPLQYVGGVAKNCSY